MPLLSLYTDIVLVSDFDFHLPEELIAQQPLAERAASRMLHLRRKEHDWNNHVFSDFPSLLRDDDLVVFNNTRVFPARLYGRRSGQRAHSVSPRNRRAGEHLMGRVEVLLTKQVSEWEWEALVRPGRKLGTGEWIWFESEDTSTQLEAEIIARGEFGERRLRFTPVEDFFAAVEKIGHVPLPPYISRADAATDRERYQTVYANPRGSVAAPTAGLHFTPEILKQLADRGIETAQVTLHVGLGTFQPIRVEKVEEHKLHSEPYEITSETAAQINHALDHQRRVVAIGTTTARTLEYAASLTGRPHVDAGRGEANIFIYPGFKFQVVGALLTNFHLPQSTLLMLVSALAGKEFILDAYRHAVEQRYRFFSYGDCMFVE